MAVTVAETAGAATSWERAYARLEEVRRALAEHAEPSPEKARRILERRARELARRAEEAPAPAEAFDIVVFLRAGERYGLEVAHILDVVPLQGLTSVPCTPSFVLGVLNHRGQILPIVDFRQLVGPVGEEAAVGALVVAVEAGGRAFGIVADAVSGLARVGAGELASAAPARSGEPEPFVRRVTREMVGVLDLEVLSRYPRLEVNDEVG